MQPMGDTQNGDLSMKHVKVMSKAKMPAPAAVQPVKAPKKEM
jgi:hypothetical protein